MKDHYIAAGVWLVLTIGGVGYGAYQGLHNAKHQTKSDEKAEVQDAMKAAIMVARSGTTEDLEKAVDLLQHITQEFPEAKAPRVNLGIAHRALGNYAEAQKQFEKVLALDPEDWGAKAELASALVEQGKEEAGLDHLEAIPPKKARMEQRLRWDPIWKDVKDAERMEAIRARHGIGQLGDTALRRLEDMERRRREFEASNPPSGERRPAVRE